MKNPADGQTCFVSVQKDVTAQIKTLQRVTQLEAQLAEPQAELTVLKATNGKNQIQN